MSAGGAGRSGAKGDAVTVLAPAKINLRLRVLAREESGFHQLETLFQALRLHDTVEVVTRKEPGVGLEVVGAEADDVGPHDENLAVRAARAFLERTGPKGAGRVGGGSESTGAEGGAEGARAEGAGAEGARAAEVGLGQGRPGLSIRLEKTIPAGAGLGGGSSDAAAVLRALDRMHPGALSPDALAALGLSLGSDVPFFLSGSTLALAWGRGERLLELPPLPSRPVVVAVPGFRMATVDAYRELAALRAARGEAGEGAKGGEGGRGGGPVPWRGTVGDLGSWDRVAAEAANDFEELVLDRHPEARTLREALEDSGARPALLTGSGSALFGVFDDPGRARSVADRMASDHPEARVFTTSTLEAWPG